MPLPVTETFNGGSSQQALSSFNTNWSHLSGGGSAWIVNDIGHADQGRPFATDYCIAVWNADAFAANQYAQFTIAAIGSGHLGAFVRGAIGADGYACRADGYITRYDNAGSLTGETILVSGLTTATTGDVLRGEAEGTTLRVLIDGVSAGSTTDATYASGPAGIWGYNGGDNYIDNWEGGNLAAAGNPWHAYAQQ
jgi:hypothetical protein